jgi:hypothetical protein
MLFGFGDFGDVVLQSLKALLEIITSDALTDVHLTPRLSSNTRTRDQVRIDSAHPATSVTT